MLILQLMIISGPVVLLLLGLNLGVVLLRAGLYLGSEEEIGVRWRQSPGGQIHRYKCFTGAVERQKIKSADRLGIKSGQSSAVKINTGGQSANALHANCQVI